MIPWTALIFYVNSLYPLLEIQREYELGSKMASYLPDSISLDNILSRVCRLVIVILASVKIEPYWLNNLISK